MSKDLNLLMRILIDYLKSKYGQVHTEVVFSSIMPVKRKFRADIYIPSEKIIVEINGGQWVNGRHNRGGVGYERDLEKMNTAQMYGFRYFQFTYEMLKRFDYERFI